MGNHFATQSTRRKSNGPVRACGKRFPAPAPALNTTGSRAARVTPTRAPRRSPRLLPAEARRLHVAVIMDGNGRWAEARGLPRAAGHRAGVEAVRGIVEAAPALGIRTLTLYAFSSDNWRRPSAEVRVLLRLLA